MMFDPNFNFLQIIRSFPFFICSSLVCSLQFLYQRKQNILIFAKRRTTTCSTILRHTGSSSTEIWLFQIFYFKRRQEWQLISVKLFMKKFHFDEKRFFVLLNQMSAPTFFQRYDKSKIERFSSAHF